jgi:hypothetical protein
MKRRLVDTGPLLFLARLGRLDLLLLGDYPVLFCSLPWSKEKYKDSRKPARGLPAGGIGEAAGDRGRAESFFSKKRNITSRGSG